MSNQPLPSILHVSSARTWRGGEQQIAYLVTFLQKQGIPQRILCVEAGEMEEWCKKQQVPHTTYAKRSAIDPKVARLIKQLCHQNKHTVVHAHDSHAHTYACIAASLFRNAVPIVLHRRVDFPVKKNRLSYWKYNHKNIKSIICVSAAIQKVIAPTIKDKKKLCVVHSGIDLARFKFQDSAILKQEYQIQEGQLLIANVAAIAGHKDYFTFVDTIEILLKKEIPLTAFIIGGDGGEQADIEQYIAQKNLQQHIILTGFRKDIPAILPEMDVFLFTSKEEGLGTSVLDAFACAVPVVATDAGGISEMVEHEKTGLLANIGDAASLAKHILRLQNEPSIKEQLTQNAQQRLQAFSKEKMGAKILSIYQEIENA